MSHPVLDLPLAGLHRIEASAGTGKTFTLALLHTRLVIERALSVRQILAVTYTVAATQELRERLRVQLDRAARLAAMDAGERAVLAATGDAATRLTAAVIARRLAAEAPAALAARLRQAVGEIDLAAVFTIHGFCQRVLAEQALAVGEPLAPREMLASERALIDEVVHDLWRQWTRELADAALLNALWKTPQALARDLPRLLRAERLEPEAAPVDAAADARLDAAAAALRTAWIAHGAQARADIETAREQKIFHGGKLRADTLAKLWDALAAFAETSALDAPPTDKLDYLTPAGLRARATGGREDAVPASPLFAAIADFLEAQAAAAHADAQRRVNLLHALRDRAAARLATLKRQRGLLGFDDLIAGVHDALAGANGAAFAASLRAQYPVALVDEFQDTDARQWAIFRRVYAGGEGAEALYLIGDPKQAIYRFRGGDVHTYHRAGRDAASTRSLEANFRSRPRVLDAIAALFARGGAFPFADGQTPFPPVHAGGVVSDADFLIDDAPAPALHLWSLPLDPADCIGGRKDPPQLKVEPARRLAAQATAARIQALLTEGRARLRDGEAMRAPQPGDIAVLVGKHAEAALVQRELAAAGIPSVTAGRASLYATEEADELLRLLAALRDPADEGRLRAALATLLLGQDAAAIERLGDDEAWHRRWLDAFANWRQRWDRHGPLALIGDRVAEAAPRLLALADGERRLTNYLQLAEQLQEAGVAALGASGLVDWLAQRIAEADEYDESQQLRLESDAERVRILTLHKAKGLEFPLVFLPFVALPPAEAAGKGLGLVDWYDGERQVLQARCDGLIGDDYETAKAHADAESRAEQLRLLYVGLTRAKQALWLAAGAVNGGERSALAWLLANGSVPGKIAGADLDRALDALAAAMPAAIAREPCPAAVAARASLAATSATQPVPVAEARRVLRRDWWVYSFSQLAREDAASDAFGETGAEDEVQSEAEALPAIVASPFSGARFGNVLHKALEHADFAAWRGLDELAPPASERATLDAALHGEGYDGAETLAAGIDLLSRLMRHTLNVTLPEGLRLCDLPRARRRDELEFHLSLAATRVSAVLELLHAHGIVRARSAFGLRERLEGLLTGKIDLVYAHAGRYYLLDYKSNQLPAYDVETLATAMAGSEYDLQYVLYALALHRWLRFRLADYDYDRHFGGVRYLFCRGLDATRADAADGDSMRSDTSGVFATRPPRALIEGLDALFAGAEVSA